MNAMNAIRAYIEKAKELDLVVGEGEFVAALIQNLLDDHESINEEILISKIEVLLENLEEMSKTEPGEGAA